MMEKRTNHILRGFSTLALAVFFFAHPISASAANIQMIPSIGLEGSWDSNIFNTNTDETSDYIFRARPRLTFFIKAYQTTILLSGGIVSEWYADNSDLDSLTATNDVTLSVEGPMEVTPRLTLTPFFRFVDYYDAVQRNVLTLPPTPDVPPAETIVTARTRQDLYQGYLRMGYRLTPRTDLFLGGGITENDASGNPTTTGQEDYRTISGDVSFLYKLTPRLSSGVFYNAGFNSYQQTPDSDTHTIGLQGAYRLTELHTLTVRGGATSLTVKSDPTFPGNDQWDPFGRVDLTYRKQYFRVTLQGSYELIGGSFGETTNRGNVALIMGNRITEKWSWNFYGGYQTNVSLDNPPTVDYDTFQGGGEIQYRVIEWASVRLAGNILRQSSSGLDENDVDRESVFLGVNLSQPYKPF